MIKGRGEGFLRATHPRGLVVLAADLDDRRVVGVEVEVVPFHRAQDLLGQRFFGLALEDKRQIHDQRLGAGLEDAQSGAETNAKAVSGVAASQQSALTLPVFFQPAFPVISTIP